MAGARRKAPLKGGLRIAIGAVADALTALPLSGMIIGGVAVIARGVPRTTRDVDLTVEGGKLELPDLVARLELVGFEPRIDGAIGSTAGIWDYASFASPSGDARTTV